ncbi:hypothetical protein MJ586_05450 [Klebsiella pneumoniae]|nr:hypothetical protein MJ586_05450 [Klebsiella pneumoniae]
MSDDHCAAVCERHLNYIMPENVFLVIAASLATFATVWVWIMILLSQIAFRRRLSPERVKALRVRVPGGVVTTVIGLPVPGLYYRPYRPSTSGHPHLAVRRYGVDCAVAARLGL